MLRNVISGVLTRLFRRKSMARESLELNTSQLARVLTVWDLTALGVGSTLGKKRKNKSAIIISPLAIKMSTFFRH